VTARASDRNRLDPSQLVFRFAVRFDQDLQRPPNQRLVPLERYALLRFHHRIAPFDGDLMRNVV
jgi:hypothetical protein